jgi:hypothetical protein
VKVSIELSTATLEALRSIADSEPTSVTRLVQRAVRDWLDHRRTGEAAQGIHRDTTFEALLRQGEAVRQENNWLQPRFNLRVANKSVGEPQENADPDVCDYCGIRGCEGQCRDKKEDR